MNADAYNDQKRWADSGIFKSPLFDASSFQRQIDKIVGVSPSGHPIVRLIWMWDARKWENTEWDEFGNATQGEWRQRYRALTVEIGNNDYVDISPPRWALEERFEPIAIAQSWELTRYRRVVTETPPFMCRYCHAFKWISIDQSEGHMLTCSFCGEITELNTIQQDVWGEVPRGGWYNLLPHIGIIANHSLTCCKEARALGETCYGTYALPSDRELGRLRRAIERRSKDAETNPHIRPDLDPVQLEQAKRWGLQAIQDVEVQRRGELAEIRKAHRPSKLNIAYSI